MQAFYQLTKNISEELFLTDSSLKTNRDLFWTDLFVKYFTMIGNFAHIYYWSLAIKLSIKDNINKILYTAKGNNLPFSDSGASYYKHE